jgi:hypothetical protein
MKLRELSSTRKLYFGYEEIPKVLGINEASAKVTASRYVKLGSIVEMDIRDYYIANRFNYLEEKLTTMISGSSM